jgi:hypothetical protein
MPTRHIFTAPAMCAEIRANATAGLIGTGVTSSFGLSAKPSQRTIDPLWITR